MFGTNPTGDAIHIIEVHDVNVKRIDIISIDGDLVNLYVNRKSSLKGFRWVQLTFNSANRTISDRFFTYQEGDDKTVGDVVMGRVSNWLKAVDREIKGELSWEDL